MWQARYRYRIEGGEEWPSNKRKYVPMIDFTPSNATLDKKTERKTARLLYVISRNGLKISSMLSNTERDISETEGKAN